MIQQPPAMHAMIMPAISPEANPRDFFFFLEPRGRTSTVGVGVGAGIGTCPRVGFRVGPGVGPGVTVDGKELDVDHLLRRLDDRDDVVHRVLHDALRQLVGGYAVDDYDESAVRGAHESKDEPGNFIHFDHG